MYYLLAICYLLRENIVFCMVVFVQISAFAQPDHSENEVEFQQRSQIGEVSNINDKTNKKVGYQSYKLSNQCQQCSNLRQRNLVLEQKVKTYQQNQQRLQERIANLQGQLSLFKQTHQNILEQQAKSLVEREENQRKSAFLENLTDSYFKMLVIHFQSITSITSYSLALEKIKMIKLFISCFKDVTGNSQKLQDIIVQNQFGVQRYIAEDLVHFKAEIKRVQLSFEILQGEQYWVSNSIPYVGSAEGELQTLVQRTIPIHSLYIQTINQGTMEYFSDISAQTGGTCQQFLVNAKNASDRLAKFIAENILEKIGGQQLRKRYEQRHG